MATGLLVSAEIQRMRARKKNTEFKELTHRARSQIGGTCADDIWV